MTGTSIDGIDVAIVRLKGRGLNMSAALLHHQAFSLGKVRTGLKALASDQAMKASEIAALSWSYADVLAKAVEVAWHKAWSLPKGAQADTSLPKSPDLISLHGQTVYHKPPYSWQLLQAAPIVQRCKAPVVCDLRSADLSAQGEGAPLTPLADMILYSSAISNFERTLLLGTSGQPKSMKFRKLPPVAIVNLGGFCNVTSLPKVSSSNQDWVSQIAGQDVCLCNLVLNHIAVHGFAVPYDSGGKRASRGEVIPKLASTISTLIGPEVQHPKRSQVKPRKSMGIMPTQLTRLLDRALTIHGAPDTAASACFAIAQRIAHEVLPHHDTRSIPNAIILAGGGSLHLRLRHEIELACAARTRYFGHTTATPRILTSDALGVPSQAREAACWAILGTLAADGVAPALPQITGTKLTPARAGTWLFP